ncbi:MULTISPECIES: DUF952 domain-containing protein [unclassified Nocardioides]|uniref:DUF952 domain-containing protein n=1 Tax=unclassified Nocardioides TaxID=2615069 RepID=UPI00116960A8|nr:MULTISPECIES: DUF952 domain-containing protein [unclassified Nocardioides]TQK70530.1 uncharacterized protein (DUF952 family) [Nocardioides sp. SLBN-35]WGY00078.1 DUF952 domain-containing protein [Nocardioides sp. QY071]
MTPIFHLALLRDWEEAQRAGSYTTSTLGRSLAEEGFIHASRADQWTGVRDRFYGEVTDPMVLLQIDPGVLDVPVVDEEPFPGAGETFPHIYGPLPVTAVVKAIPLAAQRSTEPAPTPAPEPAPVADRPDRPDVPDRPTESFSRVYFREVFFNVAVLSIVLLVAVAGTALGSTLPIAAGTALGGLLGIALGVVLAVGVYRLRHPRAGR